MCRLGKMGYSKQTKGLALNLPQQDGVPNILSYLSSDRVATKNPIFGN